ncbi:MAG: hypothetical protein U9N53_05675 [Bacteroidota bacterium]|nr:hypothetical protein [Bacteroidota bacterium]
MKKSKVLALVLIFSFLAIPFSYTWGQEKLTKQQEKEFKAQQEELKAMQEEMIKQKEVQHKRAAELYRVGEIERARAYPSYPSPPAPPVVWGIGGSENSFTLSLRKSFKGESVSKETSFTVDDDQSKIRFSVKGRCEEGNIKVKFILPSGKSFTEIQIDSSADIEWSQSLTMEKESIYKGQWKVEVKAVKAKGVYEANIKSY